MQISVSGITADYEIRNRTLTVRLADGSSKSSPVGNSRPDLLAAALVRQLLAEQRPLRLVVSR